MNQTIARKRTDRAPLYLSVLFWLGPLLGLSAALYLDIVQREAEFIRTSERAIAHITQNANTYDVALESFANFLAFSGDITDSEIRQYLQGIRKLYPDIYLFEISSRISRTQKDFFERSMRAQGYPEFRIHGFDYERREPVESLPARADYYPIRFVEPETPATRKLLGLDLAFGSDVLVETVLAALNTPRAIASRPFTLMEGGKGYVLYRPVALTQTQANSRYPISFAMLVVRADTLLPDWLLTAPGYQVSLSYVSELAGSIEESLIQAQPDESFKLILYSQRRQQALESESHPFTLTIERPVCVTDFNWLFILMFTCICGFFSRLACGYLDRERKRRLRDQQERKQLYLKANYDPLTGLPNLNLLSDLTRQTQQQALRKGGLWGILYLDLNQFKSINDDYGHDVGDQLLNQVAERLQAVLRAEDTAARLHGDEFVILLPELADVASVTVVINKIHGAFTEPFQLAGDMKSLSCSVGYALYPEDGSELHTLLKSADERMYQQKYHGKHKTAV